MGFMLALAHAMHSHSKQHLQCQFPGIDVCVDDRQ